MTKGKPRSWFAGFSGTALLILFTLPIVGLAIFLIGVNLEIPEWDRKSYLVNMVSAATGALFGIPVAVVVIQKYLADHAGRIRALETDNLRDAAIDELLDSMRVETRFSIPTGRLWKYRELCEQGLSLLREVDEAIPAPRGESLDEPLRRTFDLRENLATTFRQIAEEAAELEPLLNRLQGSPWHVRHAWSFLDTFVNPRVKEVGRRWFSGQEYASLGSMVNDILPDNSIIEAYENEERLQRFVDYVDRHPIRFSDFDERVETVITDVGRVIKVLVPKYRNPGDPLLSHSFESYVRQIDGILKVDRHAAVLDGTSAYWKMSSPDRQTMLGRARG